MKILGVVGPGATTLCERVADRLDGRVATVESRAGVTLDDNDHGRPSSVETAYELDGDGGWVATGHGRTLEDVLDDLAATHDYALLSGFSDADVPTVEIGRSDASRTVLSVEDADSADVETIVDAVTSVEPHVTLATLVERVKQSPKADRAGAIATFTGRVRALDSDDDERTVRLEFEKYEGVAESRMETISSELESREGVETVLMHHRTGVIEDGEDIVFVVVLAGHREEAFRGVEDGINRLKDEVPIFKKETTVESDFWVHERD
jgi:molybdopterin synthase catalytic subunit